MNENISNLSLFIVCFIIIFQVIFIFIKNHKELTAQHKLVALTIETSISIFFIWLLRFDNDIQEKFIIFCSEMSRSDQSFKIIIMMMLIVSALLLTLYQTLKKPDNINDISIPRMIHNVFGLVITKYILLFISFFGTFRFERVHAFSIELVHYSQSSLLFHLTLLAILISTMWLFSIIYYLYQHRP